MNQIRKTVSEGEMKARAKLKNMQKRAEDLHGAIRRMASTAFPVDSMIRFKRARMIQPMLAIVRATRSCQGAVDIKIVNAGTGAEYWISASDVCET